MSNQGAVAGVNSPENGPWTGEAAGNPCGGLRGFGSPAGGEPHGFRWRGGAPGFKVPGMLTEFTMVFCTGTLAVAVLILVVGVARESRLGRFAAPAGEPGGEGGAPPPLPRTSRPPAGGDFHKAFDVAVVAIILGLYLSQLFSAWAGHVGGEPPVISRTTLVSSMVTQFFLTFMVFGAVIWRRGPVLWLGLDWPGAQLRSLILGLLGMAAAVMATWTVALVMHATGLIEWLTQMDGGGDGKQAVVRAFEESDDPVILILLTVMAVIVAPVTEEIIFRGYLYPVARRYAGRIAAMLATSLIFAAVHYNAVGMIPLAFLSLIMTLAFERSGSIWMPIGIHMLFNGMTVLFQFGGRFGWWEVPQ